MNSGNLSLTSKKRNRELCNDIKEKSEINNLNIDSNNSQNNSLEVAEKNNKNLTLNSFLPEENIIFKYENQIELVDSAFIFKDGDILIFKNKYSDIYDAKNHNQKLRLYSLGSISYFYYLDEETFISNQSTYFTIYIFLNHRTKFQEIQKINLPNSFLSQKIYLLTNRNIICQTFFHSETRLLIYAKEKINKKYAEFKDYSSVITNVDEVIELNLNKFLTIKNTINNQLIFKVYNNKDYKLIKSNTVTKVDRSHIIYFIFAFTKINENKIINGNFNNIFIFDAQMLDLETVINFNDFKIHKLKYIKKGIILLIGEDEKFNKNTDDLEKKIVLKKLKIDFCFNIISDEKNEDYTEYIGNFISLFQIENYWDKWIYTLTGKSLLRIYSR